MTNKWAGVVGFGIPEYDDAKRRYETKIVEHQYRGETIQVFKVQQAFQTDSVNTNPRITNKISLVADEFAFKNAAFIRYVEFMGVNYTVSNISVEYPRLVLDLGGVFKNAKQNRT